MHFLTMLHILAGTISVLSGTSAIIAAKGQPLHRAAGTLFFISMSICALVGSIIAIQTPVMITFIAGLFTFYLVLTSWLTVRPVSQFSYIYNLGNLLFVGAIAYLGFDCGLMAANSVDGLLHGFSAETYYFFAFLATLCALLDGVMIWCKGHSGAHRITRHLWRMCLALYFAMGSLFTGPGAIIFPDDLQGNWILSIPENVVALLMLFWLARYLIFRSFKHQASKTNKP